MYTGQWLCANAADSEMDHAWSLRHTQNKKESAHGRRDQAAHARALLVHESRPNLPSNLRMASSAPPKCGMSYVTPAEGSVKSSNRVMPLPSTKFSKAVSDLKPVSAQASVVSLSLHAASKVEQCTEIHVALSLLSRRNANCSPAL